MVVLLSWSACAWGQQPAVSWQQHLVAGQRALHAGDAAAALQEFVVALEKVDRAESARPEDKALIRFYAGIAHFHLGAHRQSEVFHRAALAILDAAISPDADALAAVTHQLASALQNQGNYREAEIFHRRSLTIIEKDPGTDPVTLARALNNLASALVEIERSEEAQQLLERAQSMLSLPHRRPDPQLAEVIKVNLAESFRQQGRLSAAEPLYRATLERLAAADENDIFAANVRLGLALVLIARGSLAEGQNLYEKGLAVYERRLGQDHPIVKRYRDEHARLQRK